MTKILEKKAKYAQAGLISVDRNQEKTMRSSFCPPFGGCVEVTATPWKKSSFSYPVGCVQVVSDTPSILVRDSKLGDKSPILQFTAEEWWAFIQGVKNGEFDLE